MNFNYDLGKIDTILTLDTTAAPALGGQTNVLAVVGTGAIALPTGTTAEQPGTPAAGMFRWNTSLTKLEYYDGSAWDQILNSSGIVTSVAATGSTGLTVGGSPITSSGTLTFVLSNGLQNISTLAAAAGTGLVVQTGVNTFADVTLTGTAGNIVVTNGSGVAGNPTINLAIAGTPVTGAFVSITTDTFGRVTATAPATAANITAALGYSPLNKAGDTMSGVLNMGGSNITNVATPVNPSDAANKSYVDAAVTGLSWKQATAAASTTNLNATYANGASGVGATLTNAGANTAFAVDGYAAIAGDRILVKNQTIQANNGIYNVTTVGSGSVPWVLTRSTDSNAGSEIYGEAVYVDGGTTQANTGWTQTTSGTIVVGTTNLVYTQFSGSGTYTAGAGLTLTGNTFALTSPVSVTLGGTGQTTAAANGQLLIGTGSGFSLATITAGTAISVANASGSITISNTGVTSNVAGTGISVSGATGTVTISNTGVLSVAGTANQVLVNGTTGAVTAGVLTLTLPQSIGTGSSPTFANITDSGLTANGAVYAGVSGLLSSTAALTNGQILVGSTGGAPVAATLIGSAALSVTNAAGSITLTNTGVTSAVAGTGISVSSGTGAVTIANTGVLSFAGGTTGLTPASETTGDITLGGTLAVANGGTGLTTTPANGQIDIGNGAGFTRSTITAGTGISVTNGAGSISIANTGVTSVALAMPAIFTVSGSPITTTGTLTATLNTQTANTVFAGPTTGAAAAPTFRALVAKDVYGSGAAIQLYSENPSSPIIPSATGANAVAIGSAAVASQSGGFVQASGSFGATGDAQSGTYVLRNTTTNATQTELYMDGSSADYIIPASSVVTFECYIASINTAVTGAGAGFQIKGVAYRGATVGTSTLIGQPSVTIIGRTPNGLNVTAAVSATTGAIQILVTGVAATTYHWVGRMTVVEVGAV